jgi:hypothetical protein
MMRKYMKKFLVGFIVLLIVVIVFFALSSCFDSEDVDPNQPVIGDMDKELIFNPLTHLPMPQPVSARLFLVSIDNHPDARPQYGISQADLVYEIPAEGNIPRLLALFYEHMPETIGGVRSARPYMVDIAREWDAVMVHCGGSVKALNYLSRGSVDDLDEIARSQYFWRDKSNYAPHNLMTSSENIYQFLTDQEKPLVQDSMRELQFLAEDESSAGQRSDWLRLKYTAANTYYSYDATISSYLRSVDDELFVDAANNESIRVANIMVQKVSSWVEDNMGHIAMDLCAGGEAWLFSGGTMQKGSWSRADLDSPTIFVDQNGEEFRLNPGRTWIQIIDGNVGFSYDDSHQADGQAEDSE